MWLDNGHRGGIRCSLEAMWRGGRLLLAELEGKRMRRQTVTHSSPHLGPLVLFAYLLFTSKLLGVDIGTHPPNCIFSLSSHS